MNALWEIVQTRLVRRGVPIKNFKADESEPAAGGTVRRVIPIQQGIPIEAAREIVKFLKDQKLKKVQATIQADQVRVSSPSKDELQDGHARAARARLRRRAAVRQLSMTSQPLLELFVITLVAATVNGALGYGFSSITVPLALLFLTNRVLNPALVLIEVALNAWVLWVNRRRRRRSSGGACCRSSSASRLASSSARSSSRRSIRGG